jgi:metallo-beta-lactamase family protein
VKIKLFPEVLHLGAEHCVTGSCHLLMAEGLTIMVDCGSSQGNDQPLPIADWPVPPSGIDYLFLTHAHVDHVGRVPELVRAGFRGEIITTHPTKALLPPMLRDALGFSDLGRTEIKKALDAIDELSWGFEYGRSFSLKKGIEFKLGRAGHILGSCFIRFSGKEWSITFSGDLGARETPILPDPDPPEPCDLLVLESTYGDRLHEDRRLRAERLGRILQRALSDGGKVFIPAFALGRTQELLYEVDRVFSDSQQFPDGSHPPVFIDSPLGIELTRIYAGLSPYWDDEAQAYLRSGDHPIDFERLYAVAGYREHRELLDLPGPAVIIAGSGMCTGGRIVEHLSAGLEDPSNDVFFVGYQAEGTPGREIIRYHDRPGGYVRINGEKVLIKAGIHVLAGYSAHADQRGLLEWVASMGRKPSEIKLVHGEPAAQQALAAVLEQRGFSLHRN